MAYKIELGVDVDEGLYLELAIRNVVSGGYVAGDGVDHRLNVYGFARDYGCEGIFGLTVASNSNGLITEPQPGILCINVPTCALLFGGQFIPGCPPPAPPPLAPIGLAPPQFSPEFTGGDFSTASTPLAPPIGLPPPPPYQGVPIPPPYAPFFPVDLKRSLRAKLLAVPLANPAFTKTLATLVISLGGSMNPRLTLMVYPLYPNAPTASVASCQVAQMKQLLAQQGTYDRVEAGLAGPTDPATISWNAGGTMSLGGPLANKMSAILGTAPGMPIDLTGLINLAANLPT